MDGIQIREREVSEHTAKAAFALVDERAETEEGLTRTGRVETVTRNELVRRVAAASTGGSLRLSFG